MKAAIHMFMINKHMDKRCMGGTSYLQHVAGDSLRAERMFGYNPTLLTHVILSHTILILPNVLILWDASLSVSD